MSLNIGQFRKEQLTIDDYKDIIPSNNIIEVDYIRNHMRGYLQVIDKGIKLPEGMVFSKGVTYHIKMFLESNYAGSVTFMLAKDLEDSAIYMPIKRMHLLEPVNGNTQGVTEIILTFTPNEDYQYLVFCRNEALDDEGITYSIRDINIERLKNLIDTYFSNSYQNLSYLKNIGIQGEQGLRFSLNGEGFTMNSSGIFMLNDININQISFVVENENSPSFLVDFQY